MENIYYLVYQITNLINEKIYVGCHSTRNKNDNYMGSGNAIKKAIKKYGKEELQNFLDLGWVLENKKQKVIK